MNANIYAIVGCLLLASGCGNKEADEAAVDTANESTARDAAPGPLSETTPPETPPPE